MKAANTLLFDDCGLGKTIQAIKAAARFPGPKLVICNKAAKLQWEDAIWEELHTTGVVGGVVMSTGQAGRFEGVERAEKLLHTRANFWLVTHWAGARMDYKFLAKAFWDVIIADEAHKIRNRKAQTSLFVKQFLSRRKIALTATPQEKSIADMWSILNWLAPTMFKSYWQFFEEYVDYDTPMYGPRTVLGTRKDRATQIGELLAPYTLGRTKAEVAPDLPPLIEPPTSVELYQAHRELYTKLMKGSLTLPGSDEELFIPGQLTKLLRAQQLASDPEIFGIHTPNVKWDWVMDFLEGIHPDESTIIVTRFRTTAIRLAAHLKASLLVGGAAPKDSLPPVLFLTGKTRVLVGTIGAMSESLNLQRAKYCICYDITWSAGQMTQVHNRIHRMDITEPKFVYNLIAKDTVDVLIQLAYLEKWTDQKLVKEWLARGGE